MPMITTKRWKTVHNWSSEDWDHQGAWTNEKMQDELNALDEFRSSNFPFEVSLKKLVLMIQKDAFLNKGNIEYNFLDLQSVFNIWIHLSTNCKSYGRYWVAQDESYLACLVDENRKCDGENRQCKDYKQMINCKTLEELLKEEKVEFT